MVVHHDLPSEPFYIREVLPDDLDAIFRLSAHLNSVNFPHNRDTLTNLLNKSLDSFNETIPPEERSYMFVLAGAESNSVVGVSMILAQHGRPEEPHVYFDVVHDERYSSTLDRLFSHATLRLGFSYQGPTEIGALVLDPNFRAFGLGRFLSLVRFLFIAMFRNRFQDVVLAELMPPLLSDGRSELWEYIGQRFTGLTYQEADKLSHTNKEFIYALFPQTPLYASMLPTHVAKLIGQVGENTQGARKILEGIGFKYSGQIDPFDGGPHFSAQTDSIRLVKDARIKMVSDQILSKPNHLPIQTYIIGSSHSNGPKTFRATVSEGLEIDGSVQLPKRTQETIQADSHSEVWITPYP